MESKKPTEGGAWKPSPDQALLLRAALWQSEEASRAWLKWIAATNMERLDQGSYRLLPLLYLNLLSLGIEHPALPRLHALYLHTRHRNHLKLRRAAAALELLHASGIPTLVLKASALIPLYYRDPGARPMGDIDVMVPTAQAWNALELLQRAGWQPQMQPLNREYFLRMYAQTLRSADKFELDLHRHLFPFESRDEGDAAFWAGAISMQLGTVETHTLNPADQLLHTCTHGADWNPTPPVRWVADAYVLLREADIDWQRFLNQAAAYHVVLLTRHQLEYLRDEMGANIPAYVIDSLRQMPVPRQERFRYELLALPKGERNIALKLWYHYSQFRNLNQVYKKRKMVLALSRVFA